MADDFEEQLTGEDIGVADQLDGAVYDIAVDVTAVLGTATMPISQILKLGRGAVVELERYVGEEIDLRAENNRIAKGEIVVIEERLAVSITEIIKRR